MLDPAPQRDPRAQELPVGGVVIGGRERALLERFSAEAFELDDAVAFELELALHRSLHTLASGVTRTRRPSNTQTAPRSSPCRHGEMRFALRHAQGQLRNR